MLFRSYHFEKATKGESHIVFNKNNPDSGKVSNVLTQKVVGDELWPHKPTAVIAMVKQQTGQNFTSHHHQLAWKKFGVRPRNGAENPADCKKDYCHFHTAHNDYTYAEKWIQLLVGVVLNPDDFDALKIFNPSN